TLVPHMFRNLDPTTAMISALLVVGQFLITWVSLGRYLLPAVGIYLTVAIMLRGPEWVGVRQSILTVSTVAMTGLALLYAVGFWVI
ncbi:MAG TPA: hypothetical protein PK691_06035, partial [Thermomicrobiales bacterium]|nr:hypothetical protein [Thermomicrobiales bacterium]